MKIGLDVENNSKAVRQYTSIPESPRFSKTEQAGAARLDITGMYTDVNAYGVHGRTAEDLKTEAANIDVATARDYMTVMSNTMSGEDYKKAMEDGFDPADMDPEQRETILDHIKAVMAESGQVVAGFNDDLSDEKLKSITGRDIDVDTIKQALKDADLPDTDDNVKGIREAVGMLAGIDAITDGSIKYMVENDMDPTVQNIYTSTYSASGDGSRQARGYYGQDMPGYMARKADDIDWEELKPQVERAVEQMDIEGATKEQKLEDARWLIEKGIPVTEDKLELYTDIRAVDFPVQAGAILKASIDAIAQGLTPKEANLSPDHKSVYEEAYDIQSKLIDRSIGREQARLHMSADANIRLAKEGISIDTASIEDVISALKEEENKLFAGLLKETGDSQDGYPGSGSGMAGIAAASIESKIEIFASTTQAVREIPAMPAALIGRVATENDGVFTLRRAHSVGMEYKARFSEAVDTYEAVGTEVRRDLGDSITKAFRNVDDILKDLGLDVSAENQRAVRILGYNSMVINEESIRKIRNADSKLNGVIKALTPGKTLELIREGVNPLDMDIDELVSHIHETDHDPKREAEKYSRFLYKLEQNGEISDAERTSYIGIYRMLNRIERTDHAAIGRLIESGSDMTFGNLLTAMRSSGYRLDAKLDDGFGLLSERIPKGISITDQIETAFRDRISGTQYDSLEDAYLEENAAVVRETAKADDAVYAELAEGEIPITANNILAEEQFLAAPNDLIRNLRAYARRTDRRLAENEGTDTDIKGSLEEGLEAAIEDMTDAMEDKGTAYEAYKAMTQTMTDTLQQMTDFGADSMLDIRSISLMYKQLSLSVKQAESENYHIPVMIDGRPTDINLKLMHGEDSGLVTASMDTEVFGRVQTQIRVRSNRVEVSFIAEDRASLDALKPVGEGFVRSLEEAGYEDTDIRFLAGDPKRALKHTVETADNNNEVISTKALYNIAKEFIHSIREQDRF